MRRALALVAMATIAVLVFAACGGDDDDSSSPTSAADKKPLSESAYIDALATSIASPESNFGASETEAQCTAKGVVAKVGAERLQAAGLTKQWLEGNAQEATELTDAEAKEIVDAFYACYDVSDRFISSRLGADMTPAQQQCFAGDATIRAFLPRRLQQGGAATLTEPEATAFVDTMLKCVPAGVLFRNSVAGNLNVSDEQVACLNTSLMSSGDYRDALIQGILGNVDSSKTPAFADEVTKCVKLPG